MLADMDLVVFKERRGGDGHQLDFDKWLFAGEAGGSIPGFNAEGDALFEALRGVVLVLFRQTHGRLFFLFHQLILNPYSTTRSFSSFSAGTCTFGAFIADVFWLARSDSVRVASSSDRIFNTSWPIRILLGFH